MNKGTHLSPNDFRTGPLEPGRFRPLRRSSGTAASIPLANIAAAMDDPDAIIWEVRERIIDEDAELAKAGLQLVGDILCKAILIVLAVVSTYLVVTL